MSATTSFFIPASQTKPSVPRLAISLEGLDKTGKTDWALDTAPEPICLVSNDPGTKYVMEKMLARGRKIPMLLNQSWEKPDPKVIAAKDVDQAEFAAWFKEWKRFEGAMAELQARREIRTLVVDNCTDLDNLCELAHFGKLKGNARIDVRAQFNIASQGWFNNLYHGRPDLNMILIHRTKKQYGAPDAKGNANWTGNYERDGHNKMGFLIDMAIRTGWDGLRKDFYTEVDQYQATRFGAELSGKRWYKRDGESGLGWLGMSVFPQTENTPEYWGLL